MANQWFRLYAEFATDPKVQMLSEADQRRFIMLLCMRCGNGDVTLQVTPPVTPSDEEVTFQLRITPEDWARTKATLMAKDLISEDNLPTKWDKRQYLSDTSNERVKRWRERKNSYLVEGVASDVTACNVTGNVTVTPPDTDTDTDTEKKKIKKRKSCSANSGEHPDFNAFWQAYPIKTAKPKAFSAYLKALEREKPAEILAGLERYKQTKPEWQQFAHPATWLNSDRWADIAAPPDGSDPENLEKLKQQLSDLKSKREAA